MQRLRARKGSMEYVNLLYVKKERKKETKTKQKNEKRRRKKASKNRFVETEYKRGVVRVRKCSNTV